MSQLDRTYESLLDSWTGRHQVLLGGLFIGLNGLGVLVDFVMVVFFGLTSISWQTWTEESLHPTLSVAGVLATISICWLVRTEWSLVFFGAFIGGHLFAHW